ncbi:uncharacterized protein LOC100906202 [Galendromus occidentalis]|uniref:Uncharacterized protein LOC100906202 n=1 Tax=Galendromus occidentalis TaxID=34638 RepID=A0AAJ6QRE9_9ACAR|nr:uncharacterized protein LOC100906202 [Galendromus occidentalis]
MDSSGIPVDECSGLSPLMNSILELTREIENLREEPRAHGPRKVLWAKKRFPRQGIRCVGLSRKKRRKFIGATAWDFPECIVKKSAFTIRDTSLIAPRASEIFRREGSAGTCLGTESSLPNPLPNHATQSARNALGAHCSTGALGSRKAVNREIISGSG